MTTTCKITFSFISLILKKDFCSGEGRELGDESRKSPYRRLSTCMCTYLYVKCNVIAYLLHEKIKNCTIKGYIYINKIYYPFYTWKIVLEISTVKVISHVDKFTAEMTDGVIPWRGSGREKYIIIEKKTYTGTPLDCPRVKVGCEKTEKKNKNLLPSFVSETSAIIPITK